MQLTDFHVIIVKNNDTDVCYKQIVYTDNITQTISDEYSDYDVRILDESEWSADDFCEIASSLLEDVNAHKYCNKIHDIVDTMKRCNIPDFRILDFVREYTEHLFELYGYGS